MQQIAIVVFGLLVGAPQTQVTPNFAGMWTFDASKTAEAGQGAALRAGGQLSITQDGKQVTLVQPGATRRHHDDLQPRWDRDSGSARSVDCEGVSRVVWWEAGRHDRQRRNADETDLLP